jgi:hypothetical protein
MKKNICIFLFVFVILISSNGFTNTTKGIEDKRNVKMKLNLVKPYISELGEEVSVEFNRSIMQDNQVYTAEDEIWFGFTVDVADYRLYDPFLGQPPQENVWYNDTPDSLGIYSETRIIGAMNVYLDDIDLGLSSIQVFFGYNTTQDIIVTLEEGWHYLTIIAAEYVSDLSHNIFYWKYDKDQIKFYVSEEEISNPPAVKNAKNACNVEAVPKTIDELSNPFEWSIGEIRPYTSIPEGQIGSLVQTLHKSKDDATIEIHFNLTNSNFELTELNGSVVYVDDNHMGKGTIYWWMNDGEPTDENETSFQLNKGNNYVYFAAVGFTTRVNYTDFGVTYILNMMVEFNSRTYKIQNDVSVVPFDLTGLILAISTLSIVSILFARKKQK